MMWLKRRWGIRHLRCIFLAWRVFRWARMWGAAGIGLGHPNSSDLAYLDKIWKGEA